MSKSDVPEDPPENARVIRVHVHGHIFGGLGGSAFETREYWAQCRLGIQGRDVPSLVLSFEGAHGDPLRISAAREELQEHIGR